MWIFFSDIFFWQNRSHILASNNIKIPPNGMILMRLIHRICLPTDWVIEFNKFVYVHDIEIHLSGKIQTKINRLNIFLLYYFISVKPCAKWKQKTRHNMETIENLKVGRVTCHMRKKTFFFQTSVIYKQKKSDRLLRRYHYWIVIV